MSKILIEGNKVIIDGHASDLETCNTLTNLCDELSTSDKFRTVKYGSGYGEFESVIENEEKKFAVADPALTKVNIQSNDGTVTLANYSGIKSVAVTSTGAQLKGSTFVETYTYSGSKLFAGLSTSVNAIVPKYKPGDTIKITDYTTLYIVENIIIPEHHSSLTELFTNIAAVIREKTGDTASIVADDFPSVIRERLQVMLIRFTIDGTTYQAEEDMTWGEWVDSVYNTDGFVYVADMGNIMLSEEMSQNSSMDGIKPSLSASYVVIPDVRSVGMSATSLCNVSRNDKIKMDVSKQAGFEFYLTTYKTSVYDT